MRLECGCHADKYGVKFAVCARHNGSYYRDEHARMIEKARVKSEYRAKLKERATMLTGKVRAHGVTAE